MEELQTIYERASSSSILQRKENHLHFYDRIRNLYISIPKEDVSEKERQLLSHFYEQVKMEADMRQQSNLEQNWYDFLHNDGNCPNMKTERIRAVYVQLSEQDQNGFFEAVDTFFDHTLLVVWTAGNSCILIEEETDHILEKEDIYTFLDVLASDFYMTGRLFIGRFLEVNEHFRDHYKRECDIAGKAIAFIPQERVTNVEMVLPHLLLAKSKMMLSSLFAEEERMFKADDDLRKTLQLFIQNNSNVSQTAKQLHLHRNSLQYRIDKFIERTGIDVKLYEGALLVYMLCLLSGQKK